jgi:hypothetical protein
MTGGGWGVSGWETSYGAMSMCSISVARDRSCAGCYCRIDWYCRIDRGIGHCVLGMRGVGHLLYTTVKYYIVGRKGDRQCRAMRKIRQRVVVLGAWEKLGGEGIQRLGMIKLSDRRK